VIWEVRTPIAHAGENWSSNLSYENSTTASIFVSRAYK